MRLIFITVFVLLTCFARTSVATMDPTKPAVNAFTSQKSQQEEREVLALQSVFKRSNGYSAIISGKSYREGEVIGDFTLVKINPKDVVLSDGRQQKILRMYAYEIKK